MRLSLQFKIQSKLFVYHPFYCGSWKHSMAVFKSENEFKNAGFVDFTQFIKM